MTARSIVTSKMRRLLSTMHGVMFADGETRGGINRPAEKYAACANGDMSGERDAFGILDPAASVAGSKGRLRSVDGVWEMDRTASCGEAPSDDGDPEDAEDDVTDDDADAKEQRDDDGGVDDDVPSGFANGSIMHGGKKTDADDTAFATSVSVPIFDFVPSPCLPSLQSPLNSVLLLLLVVSSVWLLWGTARHPLITRMVTDGTKFLLLLLRVLRPNREIA